MVLIFGKLVKICFVDSSNIFFQNVKMYETLMFSEQFQAYQIQETENPEDLVLVKPSIG